MKDSLSSGRLVLMEGGMADGSQRTIDRYLLSGALHLYIGIQKGSLLDGTSGVAWIRGDEASHPVPCCSMEADPSLPSLVRLTSTLGVRLPTVDAR